MARKKQVTNLQPFRESDYLECLYERYHKFVYKLAWRECHRPSDIEDVVQSTWEAVCSKYDTIQKLSVPRQISYIEVTVRNIIRMDARKKKFDICSLDSIDGISYDGTVILENLLDRKILIDNFREIWLQVPPSVRELLERKYVLDQTDAEIAATMQIKPSSVRSYLSRARKAALAVLQEYDKHLF